MLRERHQDRVFAGSGPGRSCSTAGRRRQTRRRDHVPPRGGSVPGRGGGTSQGGPPCPS
ncbi:hypothetical protein [Ornithinimicrobium kibberense]|uniref:hypothetical protein n=1 Tax=Ornithinimicrobium kibberense TaxID=282060 RepID=UPI00360C914B